jgi:hypothetical protein
VAIKLYPLRNVPEDEAEEMRSLLREHDIDFHETTAGFIGIGTAAIWVNKESQFEQAKSLIEQYQLERYASARGLYQQRKARGEQTKFIDLLNKNPMKVILYVLFAIILLLLITKPFWF